MKYLAFVFVLLCAPHSYASQDEVTTGFKPYVVDGIQHSLPSSKTDKYLADYKSAASNLMSCTESTVKTTNPLIERSSTMSVSQTSTGCRFLFAREESWLYQCLFSKENAFQLGAAMLTKSINGSALGDFSKDEMKFLFNKKYCTAVSLQ
jgi:hypothetical protein